jgi:hypothetical protein
VTQSVNMSQMDIRRGADKFLAFLICFFLFAAQLKQFFLYGLKKLEQRSHKCVELRRICRVNIFFSPVACCFLYKAKDISAPLVKSKTCDTRTRKKHLLLDISSTNTDTPFPSLYQCVETRSIEAFWLLSPPLPHLRFNLFVISETSATQLWTA